MKEEKLLEILSRDTSKGYTIHQLSKIVGKSYAYTNHLARDLIDQGVLNKLVVGNAILCTLNFKNELTRTILATSSVRIKQKNLEKINKIVDLSMIEDLKKKFTISCVYLIGKELFIVCRNDLALNDYLNTHKLKVKVTVLERSDFKANKELSELYVLYGFETFWEMIADVN